MLGRGVADVIRRRGPGYPLGQLAPLGHAADLFGVNLECAVSDRAIRRAGPPKVFYFRADPAAGAVLTAAGVGLVTLANNHVLDADVSGLDDTIRTLESHAISHTGAGRNAAAAARPANVSCAGGQLGVLAWCDHQPDFAATLSRPGIHYVDLTSAAAVEALERDVRALAAHVDLVVVSCHWQPNWAPHIQPEYRALGRALVQAGAHVVWGHSPHHFQGVEWIGDRVVLYSTGGLLDDYAVDPEFRNDRQLLFELTIDDSAVRAVRALPLELDFGHTQAARSDAAAWIERRFRQSCGETGARVTAAGEWLEVRPA